MNKTMQSIMKPIDPNLIHANDAATKLEQEEIVLNILSRSSYSMRTRDIVNDFGDMTRFPGYCRDRDGWSPRAYKNRLVSSVCRRLEGKGKIVSTLFQGARLYSIPTHD